MIAVLFRLSRNLNLKKNCHCEAAPQSGLSCLFGAFTFWQSAPQNLTVLDVLRIKWQHFGVRIATSGFALLATTALFQQAEITGCQTAPGEILGSAAAPKNELAPGPAGSHNLTKTLFRSISRERPKAVPSRTAPKNALAPGPAGPVRLP